MNFPTPLLKGRLIGRRVRFLADIILDSGEQVVAHCANSGSMKGVLVPGAPVAVSRNQSPAAKLGFTWEQIYLAGGWVGINTQIPNRLVREALEAGLVPALRRYRSFRPEARISSDTRIDFVLGAREEHWLEVKNVTLVEGTTARFPDSVTTRGQKHLRHLIDHVRNGGKSTMFYVVQHHGATAFEPADDIDPDYGILLRRAVAAGVEIQVWRAAVTLSNITLSTPLDYRLP